MQKSAAAILAIGTEVTSGQITNRNAAWISAKLEAIGVPTLAHLSVPDDRSLILSGLETLSQTLLAHASTPLLFVTGGLGPTTDDFTREIVSEWLKAPLEFDANTWSKIEDLFRNRGIPVSPNNRQQCFFPRGARILDNSAGTAPAFSVARENLQIYVLPGPPREIDAVWNSSIRKELENLVSPADRLTLHTWQCLGLGESLLAEKVEAALSGSGLAVGYRVHGPYVEIKIWNKDSDLKLALPYFKKLEEAISPYLVTREKDLLLPFLKELNSFLEKHPEASVLFADHFSEGQLLVRLHEGAAEQKQELPPRVSLWTSTRPLPHHFSEAPRATWVFTLSHLPANNSDELGTAQIQLRTPDKLFSHTLQSQYKKISVRARLRAFSIEMAFKHWKEWLTQC